MYSLNCIKCAKGYESVDDDPYYCSECDAARKVIAAQIDKNILSRPKKSRRSALQEYDAAEKVGGFMYVKL